MTRISKTLRMADAAGGEKRQEVRLVRWPGAGSISPCLPEYVGYYSKSNEKSTEGSEKGSDKFMF